MNSQITIKRIREISVLAPSSLAFYLDLVMAACTLADLLGHSREHVQGRPEEQNIDGIGYSSGKSVRETKNIQHEHVASMLQSAT